MNEVIGFKMTGDKVIFIHASGVDSIAYSRQNLVTAINNMHHSRFDYHSKQVWQNRLATFERALRFLDENS